MIVLRVLWRGLGFLVWTFLLVLPALPCSLLGGLAGQARRRRLMARFTCLWCRGLVFLFAIRIHRAGAVPAPRSGRFLVANHLGYLDVAVLGSILPVTFIAKDSLRRWPLMGTLAALAATLFVERSRRMRSAASVDILRRDLRLGASFVLFAEGTTSDGSVVLPFKSSLFAAPLAAACSVQPVYISCALIGERPLAERRRAAAWFGDATFLPHLLRLLPARGVEARLRFGQELPPYPALGADARARKQLATTVREAVLALRREEEGEGPGSAAAGAA